MEFSTRLRIAAIMILNKILTLLGSLLFFLIIVFPAEHMDLKVPFIILILLSFIIELIINKKKIIFRPIFLLLTLIVGKGVIWTFIGYLNGNPGAMTVIYVNVFWYLLFGIFISQITSVILFYKMLTTLIFSALVLVLFDLAFIFMNFGILPSFDVSYIFNVNEFYFSFYSGSYLQTNHLNNLVFIFPLTLFLLISNLKVTKNIFTSKAFLIILILLELMLMILSGRRIMILTLITAPIYILLFLVFQRKGTKSLVFKKLKIYFLFFIVISLFSFNHFLTKQNISLHSISERFIAAFDNSQEPVRFEQAGLLFRGFLDSPFIGHGAAAEINGFKRSTAVPWAFEQSYLDDLFKTGILGFSMFLIFVGGIFVYGVKLIKKNDGLIVGLLVGLLCFLVANGTNPFLSSFDYFWPLFLPLAYINCQWLEEKRMKMS